MREGGGGRRRRGAQLAAPARRPLPLTPARTHTHRVPGGGGLVAGGATALPRLGGASVWVVRQVGAGTPTHPHTSLSLPVLGRARVAGVGAWRSMLAPLTPKPNPSPPPPARMQGVAGGPGCRPGSSVPPLTQSAAQRCQVGCARRSRARPPSTHTHTPAHTHALTLPPCLPACGQPTSSWRLHILTPSTPPPLACLPACLRGMQPTSCWHGGVGPSWQT